MKNRFLLSIFTIFLFFSCSTSDWSGFSNDECPYLLANINFEIKKDDSVNPNFNFQFAGTCFDFYNSCDKTVEEFTISFMLYDSEGKNPFIGSNTIKETFVSSIPSKSKKEFVVNLDDYLSVVPNEAYKIDFIYVSKIKYSDGSCWNDPFGMYSSREVIE